MSNCVKPENEKSGQDLSQQESCCCKPSYSSHSCACASCGGAKRALVLLLVLALIFGMIAGLDYFMSSKKEETILNKIFKFSSESKNDKPEITITAEAKKLAAEKDLPLADVENLKPEQVEYTWHEETANLSLQDIEGNVLDLDSFKDKVTVLIFWASWCGDCQREIPLINEVYQQYKDNDKVAFVPVNLTGKSYKNTKDEKKESALDYYKDKNINLPYYSDKDGKAKEIFGLKNIPTIFIFKDGKAQAMSVTPSGKLAYAYVGEISKENLQKAIDKALAK